MNVPDRKRRFQRCDENEGELDGDMSAEIGNDSHRDSKIEKESALELTRPPRTDFVCALYPTKISAEILLKPQVQKHVGAFGSGVGSFGDLSPEKLAGLLPISVIQAAFVKHMEIRESQGRKQAPGVEGGACTDVVCPFDGQIRRSS